MIFFSGNEKLCKKLWEHPCCGRFLSDLNIYRPACVYFFKSLHSFHVNKVYVLILGGQLVWTICKRCHLSESGKRDIYRWIWSETKYYGRGSGFGWCWNRVRFWICNFYLLHTLKWPFCNVNKTYYAATYNQYSHSPLS